MKRFFAIASVSLFVVCISAKDITALAWQIWYQVNQEYVAKELCVNKSRPQLKCNGKCHLMKQLRKLEEPASKNIDHSKGAKKPAGNVLKIKSHDWISCTDLSLTVAGEFLALKTLTWPQSAGSLKHHSSPVFHPPTAA